jgi:hypothetical protein
MGKPPLQVIGPRLLVMVVCIVVSGVLAYLYEQVPLTGTPQFVVIVLFYVSLCAWPCLLVSTLVRMLQYWQQWR